MGTDRPPLGTTAQFREWFHSYVEGLAPGSRLPTDRELAVRWGISERTVRRVGVHCLKQGKLIRVRGRGTFVAGGATEVVPAAAAPTTSAQNLSSRLTDMIHDGSLKLGDMFPSVKFLRIRFNVSPATVTAAYRILESEGKIEKIARRYRVGGFEERLHHDGAPEMALFLYSMRDFGQLYHSDLMANAYLKMERELLKFGYVLRYHGGNELGPELAQWTAQRRFPHGVILTFVNRKLYQELFPTLEKLAERRRRYKFSVLVVGEAYAGMVRGFQYVNRGTVGTGLSRALARYLAGSGYREVLLFYDAGMRSSRSLGAHTKTAEEFLNASGGRRIRMVVQLSEGSADPVDFVRRSFGRASGGIAVADRRATEALGGPPEKSIEFVRGMEEVYARYAKGAAWVFAQDSRAAEALAWTHDHRVRVPADVGIVATENDSRFLPLGMSSCMSDWETIGYQMAHALIGDFPPATTTHGFLRTPALMLKRLTTK